MVFKTASHAYQDFLLFKWNSVKVAKTEKVRVQKQFSLSLDKKSRRMQLQTTIKLRFLMAGDLKKK